MALMLQCLYLTLLVGCDVVFAQVYQMKQSAANQNYKHEDIEAKISGDLHEFEASHVAECSNSYGDEPCDRWAAAGECDHNAGFMLVQCMKACKQCTDLDTLQRIVVIKDADGCQCPAGTFGCSCCLHLNIPDIGLDDSVCLNVTYLVHDYGISVSFSIDGRVIFKYEVSARNPPPLCIDIPELRKEASLCVDFYNLDISKTAFSACTKLEARLLFFKILDVDLGCFRIPLDQELRDDLEPQANGKNHVAQCVNSYRYDNEHCDQWAAAGECDKNAAFMLVQCMKACKQCTGPEETDVEALQRIIVIEDVDGCQCPAGTFGCSCCLHLDIPHIGLDDSVCLNVTYLVHDYGIAVTFSIDGRVIYKYTVSARNPPPLCFDVPELRKDASLCLEFYNLDITKTAFSGCSKLEAELLHMKIADVDLGCFRIPLSQEPRDDLEPQVNGKNRGFEDILSKILKDLRGDNVLKKK